MALTAAIWPKVKGSSTVGVKKSTVCTSARSSEILYTPASSACSYPVKRFGSEISGKSHKISDRSPGPILQAQPAPCTVSVNRSDFSSFMLFEPFFETFIRKTNIEYISFPYYKTTHIIFNEITPKSHIKHHEIKLFLGRHYAF